MKGKPEEDQGKKKKRILEEDLGKTTPPSDPCHDTKPCTHPPRPEQGPDVPPQEQTRGIP
ncbi:hypothetical protein [Pontibacter ruber]|uniref:hypothetical protein n=1 Tax=Pontibacter ruber TaxID=1343895 RepID=UPI002027A700|nr:hypothetical protein [Pontibacter ruber]